MRRKFNKIRCRRQTWVSIIKQWNFQTESVLWRRRSAWVTLTSLRVELNPSIHSKMSTRCLQLAILLLINAGLGYQSWCESSGTRLRWWYRMVLPTVWTWTLPVLLKSSVRYWMNNEKHTHEVSQKFLNGSYCWVAPPSCDGNECSANRGHPTFYFLYYQSVLAGLCVPFEDERQYNKSSNGKFSGVIESRTTGCRRTLLMVAINMRSERKRWDWIRLEFSAPPATDLRRTDKVGARAIP